MPPFEITEIFTNSWLPFLPAGLCFLAIDRKDGMYGSQLQTHEKFIN